MNIRDPKRITAIVGHFGCGKTEIAINMAEHFAKSKKMLVCDMDTVNPYYRTKDAEYALASVGVKLIAPDFANTNVDLPSLPAKLAMAFDDKSYTVILDIGGDDDGAIVLGAYRNRIIEEDYDMFYVVNQRRLQISTPKEAYEYLKAIESVSSMKVTGIINNTNLAMETTKEIIKGSVTYARELSEMSGIPIVATCVREDLVDDDLGVENIFPVKIHIKRSWEEQ